MFYYVACSSCARAYVVVRAVRRGERVAGFAIGGEVCGTATSGGVDVHEKGVKGRKRYFIVVVCARVCCNVAVDGTGGSRKIVRVR